MDRLDMTSKRVLQSFWAAILKLYSESSYEDIFSLLSSYDPNGLRGITLPSEMVQTISRSKSKLDDGDAQSIIEVIKKLENKEIFNILELDKLAKRINQLKSLYEEANFFLYTSSQHNSYRNISEENTSTPQKGSDPSSYLSSISNILNSNLINVQTPESSKRFLNVGFFDLEESTLLDKSKPLLLENYSYILKVNIGAPWGLSDESSSSFPENLLAEQFEDNDFLDIDVYVSSDDVTISDSYQKVNIGREGNSRFLKFKVDLEFGKYTIDAGRKSLDIDLLYYGNLIQSKRVEFNVVGLESQVSQSQLWDAQSSYTTWTRTISFSTDELLTFQKDEEKLLTVLTEREPGTERIGLRFIEGNSNGGGRLSLSRVTHKALSHKVDSIYRQMKTMMDHYAEAASPDLLSSTDLLKCIAPIAVAGSRLYAQIFRQSRGQKPRELNGIPPESRIQIAPLSDDSSIPWEVLYERPLESYTAREGNLTFCKVWRSHIGSTCSCNSDQNSARIICPLSFWGYKYIVEQLPCRVRPYENLPTHPLPRFVKNQFPIRIASIPYDRFQTYKKHERDLRALGTTREIKINRIRDRAQFTKLVKPTAQNPSDIIYFYTHTVRDEDNDISFKVGSETVMGFEIGEVWDADFHEHAPMVFLNTCESAQHTFRDFESLVQTLCDRGVVGVIGTQCPIKESLASKVSLFFFKKFLRGMPAGKALHETRKDLLLNRGNNPDLRALVYSLFALSSVKLAQPISR